jgi:LytS/YehU family sensor histidine kinase
MTVDDVQHLKLEFDSHFILNSLSALSELILRDQRLAYEYAEDFTRVYRYLLTSAKKDLVLLREELHILRSYIHLLKTRTGEGITWSISIDASLLNYQIPPMTLQSLVGNAVHYNKTKKNTPLRISVYSTDDRAIIVANNSLPLNSSNIPEGGTRLSAIFGRYVRLSDKLPVVETTEDLFIVKVPLL